MARMGQSIWVEKGMSAEKSRKNSLWQRTKGGPRSSSNMRRLAFFLQGEKVHIAAFHEEGRGKKKKNFTRWGKKTTYRSSASVRREEKPAGWL